MYSSDRGGDKENYFRLFMKLTTNAKSHFQVLEEEVMSHNTVKRMAREDPVSAFLNPTWSYTGKEIQDQTSRHIIGTNHVHRKVYPLWRCYDVPKSATLGNMVHPCGSSCI